MRKIDYMIDYNKINEYVASMITKSESCCRLTSIAIDNLFGGKNQHITERDIHDGIECLIAKNKKEVEENPYATTEQKESEKTQRELILRCFEEWIKTYLKGRISWAVLSRSLSSAQLARI